MRHLSENNNEFGISTDEKREDTQKDRLPWQRHVLDFLEIKRNEKKTTTITTENWPSLPKVEENKQYVIYTGTVCGPWSATFRKMIKYFVEKKSKLNNERYRDLLISILSYDDVSAFLLWVKTRNWSLLTGRLICLSWSLDFCGTVNYMVMFT